MSAAHVLGAAVTTAWILLGVAALLIIGNALFVAAETGLVTIDRNLVEARAADGTPRFGTVAAILRRLSTYLSGAQLGITVTSLAIGLVAEPSIATLLRGPLETLGLVPGQPAVHSLAVHPEPRRHARDRLAVTDHRQHGLIPLLGHAQLPLWGVSPINRSSCHPSPEDV